MRVKCPLCSEDLGCRRQVMEYGFIREDGKFLMLEWTETDTGIDDLEFVCYTEDCKFALADYPVLAERIANHMG